MPAPRDPIKALILERQLAYGITSQSLASAIGISRQTFSHMMRHMHTDEWELGQIRAVLFELNVTAKQFADCLAGIGAIRKE